MEKVQSNRFSFRRKGSRQKKEKEEFDHDKISFVSQAVAKEIFQDLVTEYTFSVDQILELSGYSCAVAIAKVYPKTKLTKGKGSILVCCGPGKNGAEGLVCARHLKLFGYRPTVFYPMPPGKQLFQKLATQCEKTDIPFLLYLPSEVQLITDSYNLIVDAIFGCNFQSPTTQEYQTIIQLLIKSKLPTISISVPSGWEVDGGGGGGGEIPAAEAAIGNSCIQPELLISLMVPVVCAKQYRGKHHFLCCPFLPPDLIKKYDLTLPPYNVPDLIIELKTSSLSTTTTAAATNTTAAPEGDSGGDSIYFDNLKLE